VEESSGTKQGECSGWKEANRSEWHFGYQSEDVTDFGVFSSEALRNLGA
jgi:hypothetical protein